MKESKFQESKPSAVSPPPLPLCLLESKTELLPLSSGQGEDVAVEESKVEVAVKRLLSSKRNLKSVFYLKNFSLVPQLQNGPKCGLVALSIATSVSKNFVDVKDIYKLGLEYGFTKQGEMFDANALAILAEQLGFKAKVLDGGLESHLSCILKSLINKCLLLVPYDADFNHAPCCKGGSRAHWAIISGVAIMEEKSENEEDSDVIAISLPTCNVVTDQQMYFSKCLGQTIEPGKREDHRSSKKGKVYLIGLQGKSRHIGIWSFEDMALSNNNLINFPSTRNPEMYVVPEGGIVKGLKGRAVLLEYSGVA